VIQVNSLQLGRGFAGSGTLASRPVDVGFALGATAGVELGNSQDQKLLVG